MLLEDARADVTAGMASWLALGKAPAFAQKRELTFLSWNHFVPASDDELSPAQALAFFEQFSGINIESDLIPWLHGEFTFVFGGVSAGPTPVNLGLIIQPTDRQAATRTLGALRSRLDELGTQFGADLQVVPRSGGFDVVLEDTPIAVRQNAQRVVVASSPEYAAELLTTASSRVWATVAESPLASTRVVRTLSASRSRRRRRSSRSFAIDSAEVDSATSQSTTTKTTSRWVASGSWNRSMTTPLVTSRPVSRRARAQPVRHEARQVTAPRCSRIVWPPVAGSPGN